MVVKVLVKDMTADEYARHKAANRRAVKSKALARYRAHDELKRKERLARKLEREMVKMEKLWASRDAATKKRAQTLARIEARKLNMPAIPTDN